jgi:protein-S-isoprenylcysteine O-methyltransferase Ste14
MLLKQLFSIIALPVTILMLFPIFLMMEFDFMPLWGLESFSATLVLGLGFALIALGLIQLIYTISIFFSKGKGTIAPWNPTMNLIKTGIYGHIRNPMMIAVFFVLMGESSIIGSVYLVFYSVIFVIVNLFYIPLVEEPKLVKRFGEEYLKYQNEVPRWLPTKCQRNKQK